VRVVAGLLGLAYPALVYLGLTRFDVRGVALGIVFLAGARLAFRLRGASAASLRAAAVPFVLAGLAAAVSVALDDGRIYLFAPAAINGALLFSFARTLRRGTPMVETFARLQTDDLTPAEVAYCRTVTGVWSGFFAVNGGVALALALLGSLESWALYNGLVAYLLIAALFTAEFVYRTWRFRRYRGAVTDPLLRRIFPPRSVS
jgi:uncharacterized membrane protein